MTDRRETESTERRLSAMLRTAFCPVVRAALNAETTIEVMVNPDGSVWIEEAGRGLIQTGNTIAAGDRERVIRLVASSLSAGTSSVASIVSAELPGTGERFEGILPPVSAAPCYSIRKLARAPFTLADYVQQGALSPALADKLKALVTQNVYDTVRGQHLLIPQGSRLLGRYQSEVSFGQDRALVVWDRILMPDGSSITISEPGSDVSGYAGLKDRTDHHWDKVFAAAGLATLLGIGAELGPGDDGNIERAIRRGTTDTINEAGQRAVDRSLSVQPSITIRPGWPVRVIVTKDLVLRPFQETAP